VSASLSLQALAEAGARVLGDLNFLLVVSEQVATPSGHPSKRPMCRAIPGHTLNGVVGGQHPVHSFIAGHSFFHEGLHAAPHGADGPLRDAELFVGFSHDSFEAHANIAEGFKKFLTE